MSKAIMSFVTYRTSDKIDGLFLAKVMRPLFGFVYTKGIYMSIKYETVINENRYHVV